MNWMHQIAVFFIVVGAIDIEMTEGCGSKGK
jgi:hypothetical protein